MAPSPIGIRKRGQKGDGQPQRDRLAAGQSHPRTRLQSTATGIIPGMLIGVAAMRGRLSYLRRYCVPGYSFRALALHYQGPKAETLRYWRRPTREGKKWSNAPFPVQRGIEDGTEGLGTDWLLSSNSRTQLILCRSTRPAQFPVALQTSPAGFGVWGAKVLTMGVRSALDLNQTRKRRKP